MLEKSMPDRSDGRRPDGEGVRAAETTLQILETVAFAHDPLGVTQIASKVGLAKSAAFKHLHTLAERGYVTQDTVTSQYRLGPKAWLISRFAPSSDDIAGIAEPLMRDFRNETGLAVVLSIPMTNHALVVATLPGTKAIEIGVRPGSELEFYGSAQGKILLAYGPQSRLENLKRREWQRLTPETITSFDRLVDEVGEARKKGYATAPNESLLGVNTIAAPVYDYRDHLVGAVGIVGSIQHVPREPDEELVAAIRTLSSSISQALGNGLVDRRA